jgi:hypothetical protein
MGEKQLVEKARLAELITKVIANGPRKSGEWLFELIELVPWQIRLTTHFSIHYYHDAGRNQAFLDALTLDLERLHSEVTNFLPCEKLSNQAMPQDESRLECSILHTSSPRTFGSVDGSNYRLFYLLDTKHDPEYLERLRHEIVHMLWGRRHGEAPPLFTEGIAVYAEHFSAPNADINVFLQRAPSVLANTPPLVDIADTQTFWERGSFYTAGGLFVWYLIDRWGWEHLGQLFELSCYCDMNILDHFYEVYQEDLFTVDVEWRRHLSSL